MSDYYGLNLDLEDFAQLLSDDDLVEEPVDIRTFINDRGYLNMPTVHLSDLQLEIIRHVTQIFKPHTLAQLKGEEEGLKYYKKYTVNEVIDVLGKGSGKDFTSRIAFAYVFYLLHCIKDPSVYYNKAPGDYVDLLNVAVNAQQAQNVFFQPLKEMLKNAPYFEGTFEPRRDDITFFERQIRAFSGHSESEGWEGYNLLLVVLDEIAAFKTDNELRGDTRSRHSASAIYKMSRRSVTSRFPDVGKVVLLSFPRFKGDFIQMRYEDIIADKEVVIREHEFIIHPDLPDDPENKFKVKWEEDHILAYRYPKVWALRRPTWDVNPTINIEDFKNEFLDDEIDALARFACLPPEAENAFFRDREALEDAFPPKESPFYDDWSFKEWFKGDEKPRFIHIDLASRHDRAAVAMCHSPGLMQVKLGNESETLPKIVVDAVRWWKAPKNGTIDFGEIRQYVFDLQRRGFNIAKITFDQWQSETMMQEFRSRGMNADLQRVAKNQYDNLAYVINDRRLYGYHIDIMISELLRLKLINNKTVDHPNTGSKDLSDALCGAVFAVSQSARYDNVTGVDIVILEDVVEKRKPRRDNVLEEPTYPKKPKDIDQWLKETNREPVSDDDAGGMEMI